jgi:hypothetical protein
MQTMILDPRIIVVAAVAAIFVWGLSSIPAAAQGTPEQRAACEGDAQRVCGQFIPDVDRITACIIANQRYLSRDCRRAMEAGRKRGRARD